MGWRDFGAALPQTMIWYGCCRRLRLAPERGGRWLMARSCGGPTLWSSPATAAGGRGRALVLARSRWRGQE